MKKMRLISLLLALVFQSCDNPAPTSQDIIGKWESSDGAKLEFKPNGVFEGESLPGEKIFFPSEEFKDKRFNGVGKWKLKDGQGWWELTLNFNKISNRENGYDTQILISREDLGNGDKWYLFEWEEEEGGERYKFFKKE